MSIPAQSRCCSYACCGHHLTLDLPSFAAATAGGVPVAEMGDAYSKETYALGQRIQEYAAMVGASLAASMVPQHQPLQRRCAGNAQALGD
jgi:hypothetical protein